MAITQEQLEQACFQLISFSGAAKSDYLEAIEYAKTGNFTEAEAAITRQRGIPTGAQCTL